MKFNEAEYATLERMEGYEPVAYLCPAGVPTIGFGHTIAAGPPRVTGEDVGVMRVSKIDARQILRTDIESFSADVRRVIKVNLNNNQFTAVVLFTHNVGIGNLLKSSALKSINAGRFDEVPAKMLLWKKARDPSTGKLRVLNGLVRRRKYEGDLFMRPVTRSLAAVEDRQVIAARGMVEQDTGTPMVKSTTNIAAAVAAAAPAAAAAGTAFQSVGEALGGWPTVVLASVAILAAAYIIIERRRHAQESGV